MIEKKLNKYLDVVDHSVSKKVFTLVHDEQMDMLLTTPKPNEVELPKFYESDDYISHTDNKRSLLEHLYQIVKQIALKSKIKIVNSLHPQKGIILDIGAGTGDFLLFAKNNGWKTIGIEPNVKATNIAKQKGISYIENSKLAADHSFDVITMWHVLEHVPDVQAQITDLKRLLKPDGLILIAVPNFKSYDAKYYKEFWAAYDVPRHLSHFSQTSIKMLFKEHNLNLIKTIPMKFDAFYVSLLSEKYKSGKINYFKAFYIALKSNWRAAKNSQYSSIIYVFKNEKS